MYGKNSTIIAVFCSAFNTFIHSHTCSTFLVFYISEKGHSFLSSSHFVCTCNVEFCAYHWLTFNFRLVIRPGLHAYVHDTFWVLMFHLYPFMDCKQKVMAQLFLHATVQYKMYWTCKDASFFPNHWLFASSEWVAVNQLVLIWR